MTKPLHPPSPEHYRTGVKLIVARTRRNLPSALPPQIKATNFLNNILAKREAIAAGAFDSILLNWESHLTECTVSNLFFVRAGRLCTPALACGLLDGITRNIVLSLAQEAQIPVDEGYFGVEAIYKADECFLTNTSMEVMPVTMVDGHPVGKWNTGTSHPGTPQTIYCQPNTFSRTLVRSTPHQPHCFSALFTTGIQAQDLHFVDTQWQTGIVATMQNTFSLITDIPPAARGHWTHRNGHRGNRLTGLLRANNYGRDLSVYRTQRRNLAHQCPDRSSLSENRDRIQPIPRHLVRARTRAGHSSATLRDTSSIPR